MADDYLKFELDGPDVHQRTVDAEAMLALALSYLALVRKAAEERGAELTFEGIHFEEKCVQLISLPSDAPAALMGAIDVSAMLGRQAPVPDALKGDILKFRRQLRTFPQQIDRTTVWVGQSEPIGVAISWEEPPVTKTPETFSGRGIVTRVGGAKPTVRISSRLEPREMTLRAEKDLAKEIGASLYKEVEVEARVWRDESGLIVDGELVDFEPVTDADPTKAWGEVFRAVGDEYRDMSADEINEELGRG
jgi:hypothetical protein